MPEEEKVLFNHFGVELAYWGTSCKLAPAGVPTGEIYTGRTKGIGSKDSTEDISRALKNVNQTITEKI